MRVTTGAGALAALTTGTLFAGCSPGKPQGDAVADVVPVGQGDPRLTYGALLSARVDHQATHLGDDLVLVTGGRTLDALATDTAEVLDGRTGQRTALPDRMTTPRAGHQAVLLPTGEVLLLGGHDAQGAPLASAEVWDPRTLGFRALAEALSTPRDGLSALVVGDRLLLAGGHGRSGAEVWSLTPPRPVAIIDGAGAPGLTGAGRLVPLDGAAALFCAPGAEPVVLDLERMATAAPRGEYVQEGTPVRATVLASERTLLVGGRFRGRPTAHPQQVTRRGADELSFLPVTLPPVDEPTLLADGERLVVAGGLLGGQPVADVGILDAAGWRRTTPLAAPRRGVVATSLTPGRALFSGGVDFDGRPMALIELLSTDPLEATQAFQQAILTRQDLERRLAELDRLRQERDDALARLQQLLDEIQRVQGQIAAQLLENARLTAERDRLQAELDALNAQVARLTQQIQATEASIRSLQSSTQATLAQIQQAQAQLASLNTQLAQVNAQVSSVRTQQATLQSQLAAGQASLSGLQSQQAALAAALPATSPLSVSLQASARVLIVGGSYASTVSFQWQAAPSDVKVDIQVRSDVTFANWTTILRDQQAVDVGTWNATGAPGEGFWFRAVARSTTGQLAYSNTVRLQ